MQEELFPIKGYEGKYSITKSGKIFSHHSGRYLKNNLMTIGYYSTSLWLNGKGRTTYIHRLLAETFIENTNNYMEVNHIDGDKKNNSIPNLEWCSHKHNMQEAKRIGLNVNGLQTYKVNFEKRLSVIRHVTCEIANEIREHYKNNIKICKIVIMYGIKRDTVNDIIRNKTYINAPGRVL